MAKLITTEEERAAASYLDWDDESVGRMSKYLALKFMEMDQVKADETGSLALGLHSACMVIVNSFDDSGFHRLELTVTGYTHHGQPRPDYKITITRDGDRPPLH